jgi:hypothetical protein
MIDFIGALAASLVLGFILGSRIRKLSAVTYIVLFLLVLAVSFFVGNYPFYTFEIGTTQIPMNLVFITSFIGIVLGSAILGGVGQ